MNSGIFFPEIRLILSQSSGNKKQVLLGKSNQRSGAVSGSICDHGTDHNGDRSQQRTW